jgi:NAD-dependent deacetylase
LIFNDKILLVTAAGISVESGIQPFRGYNGIWEKASMEMATFQKFESAPADFLVWYCKRFKTCLYAKPNIPHKILASSSVSIITQNINVLHRAGKNDSEKLVEIHGCLYDKRPLPATWRAEIVNAYWSEVDEGDLINSLFKLFKIQLNGRIILLSNRPHVLLLDEFYSKLYDMVKSLKWDSEADNIVFMVASNFVGITGGILQIALENGNEIFVVGLNLSPSYLLPGITINREFSSGFCKFYLNYE